MTKQSRATRILKILGKRYTEKGGTDLGNPNDTLIATVLSARTTDAQVLRVFPSLRKAYPNWKALRGANQRELEGIIRSIGFYKTKARRLKELAAAVLDRFNGRVPKSMEELVTLPGVGRKTASIVLSFCFDEPAIAVDTHVTRIAKRLGWTQRTDPKNIERDLKALLPKSHWSAINRVMVPFGRDVCRAPKPQCWRCPVAKLCPFEPKTPQP